MVTIIAAMTDQFVIGKGNTLPWHIPDEFKHFKEATRGHPIIMGRKTFESIGRPLPNRQNIVVSSSFPAQEGIEVCATIPEALACAKKYNSEPFIIGGGTIYKQALPFTDRMIISRIKKQYPGDVFFPEFDSNDWNIEERKEYPEFEVIVYKRK